MRYFSLFQSGSTNIGDAIQTLAVESLLPRVDGSIDPRELSQYRGEPTLVVLNAFFDAHWFGFPPSPDIIPFFWGFHLDAADAHLYLAHADYLKRWEPIGCRDHATADLLREAGIEAFVSYCSTLHFPRSAARPDDGDVVMVDTAGVKIGDEIRKRPSTIVSHLVPTVLSDATRRLYAEDLLSLYSRASLVATRRLHCALPCVAMRVPVVYFGNPNDRRITIVKDFGVTFHDIRAHQRGGFRLTPRPSVNWFPEPVVASAKIEGLKSLFDERLASLTQRA